MQLAVAALHAVRRGVGNALAAALPADSIAIGLHQRNEFRAATSISHTLIHRVNQPQLPALSFKRGVIFSAAHAAGMAVDTGVEHRQSQLLADGIVALLQLLHLLFCQVQLFAGFKVDRVDDAVGVNMLTVNMGTDEDFTALKIF